MSDVETAQTGATVAPVENTASPQEQTQEQAQNPTTEQDTQPEDQPRDEKGRWVPQERVNEITKARRVAERRAQYLEQQLSHVLNQQQPHAPQSQDKAPQLQDFQTVEDWAAAVVDHATRTAEQRTEQKFQQYGQHYTQQQLAQQFAAKEAAFASSAPDYMERVAEMNGAVQFAPEMLEAIALSDHGPALAYHLATHLDEADRIARMPPHIAAVQIGRLEAQLAAPKPKPVTKAPNPVPTVGGGAAAPRDPERMSIDDWMAQRNSQITKR